jgi:ferrous iron transport protein A
MHRFRGRFGPRLRFRFGGGFRPEGKKLTLARMRTGRSGKVVEVLGGRGISSRLSALGLRPGLRVTKVSSMFMRGPVTVQLGNSQIAIGFGMANKIIVEPEEYKDDIP